MIELKVYATLLLITFVWHVYKIIKICFEENYSCSWLWGVYDRVEYELFYRNRLTILWSAITFPLTFFWVAIASAIISLILAGILLMWLLALIVKTFLEVFKWVKGLKLGSKIKKYFTEDLDQKHW